MILRYATPTGKRGALVSSTDYSSPSAYSTFLTDAVKNDAGESFDDEVRLRLVARKMGFNGAVKRVEWQDGTRLLTHAKNAERAKGASLTEWDTVLQ